MVCQFYERHGKKNEAEKTIQNLAKTHADKLPLLVKLAEMKLQGTICMKQGDCREYQTFLTKAKRDDEIVRAAKVFDQLGMNRLLWKPEIAAGKSGDCS